MKTLRILLILFAAQMTLHADPANPPPTQKIKMQYSVHFETIWINRNTGFSASGTHTVDAWGKCSGSKGEAEVSAKNAARDAAYKHTSPNYPDPPWEYQKPNIGSNDFKYIDESNCN